MRNAYNISVVKLEKQGLLVDSCGQNNEPPDFIRGGKYTDQLSYYQVLKSNSAPWSESLELLPKPG
jgi:hypothetical protein